MVVDNIIRHTAHTILRKVNDNKFEVQKSSIPFIHIGEILSKYDTDIILGNYKHVLVTKVEEDIFSKRLTEYVLDSNYFELYPCNSLCEKQSTPQELSQAEQTVNTYNILDYQINKWVSMYSSTLLDEQLYVLIADTKDSMCFNKVNKSTLFNKADIITHFKEFPDRVDNVNIYPIGNPMKMNISYELKEN